mgnify:CR=1 FL=1
MNVTTFAVAELLRIVELAREAGEASPNGPAGWSKSEVDPAALLAAFPALRLREGFALRAYRFRKGEHGNGVVWALPSDLPFPEPADCPKVEDLPLRPPRPAGALHPMAAVAGDGSALAYLSASLLARELAEWGALGRGRQWRTHALIGAEPAGTWQWLKAKPADWRPQVRGAEGLVTVTFYTRSDLGREAIHRHLDTYAPGSYVPSAREQRIAQGGAGYLA